MNLRRLIFVDSRDPSALCKRFSLSADGKLLAASFASGDVLVWRLSDGLLVQRLHHQGHTEPVYSLAFSPDNHSLVSGSEDTTAIVWDIRHGRALLRLEGHCGTVGRVAYAPYGAFIATASDSDESVKIWDATTGACLHSFDIKGRPHQVAFSPNGSHVYIDGNNCCSIYETQTYTYIAELRHRDEKYCESSVSRQGDRIVTASLKDQVKIWSAETGEQLLTIDHPRKLSYPAMLSPDGSEVVAACDKDKTAAVFDSWTGQLRRVYPLSRASYHASYSPHGDYVAFGDGAGVLYVHDAKSGRLHHQGHAKPISSLAFSPDDRSLASGAEDGTVVIWDIRHGRALLRLEGHRGTVKRIVYAPHGALIATGSDYDHSVKIWDASTGTCLHRIGLARDLCQVAFSPNSSHLYIDQIGTCWIYETQTYTCIAELGPLTPGYHQLSVSRQGDRIVTTSRDGQVKIWSAVTGEELLTIDYPKGLWDPAILSPDGSEVLAACAPDGTAVTFDSWTGQLRRVYELPRVSNHVSYSLDGDCVAMEDIPGDLHVRDAKSGAFLAKFKALSRDAGFNDEPLFLLGNQNFMVHFSDGLSLLHNIQDMLRLR
ncbi:uncharacterized protein PHACADRAFT_135927 [Phanerochaete carnosa HHB-10118-sp]|uniref:Pyrrolo-quinoline quinone repeat domain-containing protein n=1 Tax=Phanerochaete carnosa (strain HHB-10118-sp) TaxID=650164 RepID=K5WHL3_PHACS|nr:uncharacterized protein PHACADRAFT_135927 [Phanerochaete carnosa HHB-10118-sp]EKM58805.1 hypothetical protein PHACADRAFT_135927 [Phanerochaete carnosa HHB-10118-sp]